MQKEYDDSRAEEVARADGIARANGTYDSEQRTQQNERIGTTYAQKYQEFLAESAKVHELPVNFIEKYAKNTFFIELIRETIPSMTSTFLMEQSFQLKCIVTTQIQAMPTTILLRTLSHGSRLRSKIEGNL